MACPQQPRNNKDAHKNKTTRVSSISPAVAEKTHYLGTLLARICVGYMFAKSGYNLFSKLDAHANYFRGLGVPAPEIMAPFVVTLELVGGTLLILGIGTRIMSIMLAGVMAVALLTEHFDKVKNDLSVLFYHSDFLLILLLVWIVLTGPGKLSIDHVLRRKLIAGDDA